MSTPDKPGGREPEYVEHPGYGIWPCSNEWHRTQKPYPSPTGSCPNCPNLWWASDGSECPEEYALIAEIDWLRSCGPASEQAVAVRDQGGTA